MTFVVTFVVGQPAVHLGDESRESVRAGREIDGSEQLENELQCSAIRCSSMMPVLTDIGFA